MASKAKIHSRSTSRSPERVKAGGDRVYGKATVGGYGILGLGRHEEDKLQQTIPRASNGPQNDEK